MAPGYIPDETVEEIRSRSDIVAVIEAYVPLKRRGYDYWACCPFHQEKTPSFKVSSQQQSYYCFGCQQTGNVFSFVMARENLDFPAAVRLLAQRAGVIIAETTGPDGAEARQRASKRERIFEVLARVANWYHQLLTRPEGAPAASYLHSRGIAVDAWKTFQLGYAPDAWDATLQWAQQHGYDAQLLVEAGLAIDSDKTPGHYYDRFRGRLIFPICDELGRVIGFSARLLDPEVKAAKYINTPETLLFHKSSVLYGLHLARQAFRSLGAALVCEGQLDVIACHRAGQNNAVAPQGTAFTEEQARMLKRFTDKVVFAFDSDAAGIKAARRSISVALDAQLQPTVVVLPDGADPDSLLATGGPEALVQVIADAQDALPYVLSLARQQHVQETPQALDQIVAEVLAVIAHVQAPVARAAYCQWLAGELHLPESAVREALQRQSKASFSAGRKPNAPAPMSAALLPTTATVPPMAGNAAGTSAGNDMLHKSLGILLDLALHHEQIAVELCNLDHEILSSTAAGRALNMVLGLSQQGEWQLARQELGADQDIIRCPEVGKALMNSEFAAAVEAAAAPDQQQQLLQRLRQAATDCQTALERHYLDKRLEQLSLQLQSAAGDQARALLEEYQQLVRRKH